MRFVESKLDAMQACVLQIESMCVVCRSLDLVPFISSIANADLDALTSR